MGSLEFESEIDYHDRTLNMRIEVDYTIECEDDYGADADGNRGEKMEYIDDMNLKIFDGMDNDVTLKMLAKNTSVYNEIKDICRRKIWENEECT